MCPRPQRLADLPLHDRRVLGRFIRGRGDRWQGASICANTFSGHACDRLSPIRISQHWLGL